MTWLGRIRSWFQGLESAALGALDAFVDSVVDRLIEMIGEDSDDEDMVTMDEVLRG